MNQTGIIIIVCIMGLVLISLFCNNKEDPIAERINAIENASWGMQEENKKELLLEVIKGYTNQIPKKETPLEK